VPTLQGKRAAKNYPLSCAGIRVGVSTDAQVQRHYGKGYFVESEGHGGGRYFVDSRHRVTLHTEIGVDQIIESLEYQQGVHLPRQPTTAVWRQATAARLSAHEKVQGGIQLGARAQAVLGHYGRPTTNRLNSSTGVRIITYTADEKAMADVLFYEAEFRFRNDRLVGVSLYNGE